MRVLLLGANGRTGKLVMDRLFTANHVCTPFGRSTIAQPGSTLGKNFPLDITLLMQASLHHDAVINCLGTSDSGLHIEIAAALDASHKRTRYLTVGGLGVYLAAEQAGLRDRMTRAVMQVFGESAMTDRQGEADFLQQSRLDWTMLRIPRLVDGIATNSWILKAETPVSPHITRSDLADALVACLQQPALIEAAPFLSGQNRPAEC